jgi:mRNA interferase MazF
MMVKRGDIFIIDIPKDERDPHKQTGERPCLIISNNMNNMHCSRIQYIPLTSKDKKYIPTHVLLKSTYCLAKKSTALCECIDSIDKSFIKEKIGVVSDNDYKNIKKAIDVQLDMNRDLDEFDIKLNNNYAYA